MSQIKTVLGKLIHLNYIQLQNNEIIRAIPFNFHNPVDLLDKDCYFQLQEISGGWMILNVLVVNEESKD